MRQDKKIRQIADKLWSMLRKDMMFHSNQAAMMAAFILLVVCDKSKGSDDFTIFLEGTEADANTWLINETHYVQRKYHIDFNFNFDLAKQQLQILYRIITLINELDDPKASCGVLYEHILELMAGEKNFDSLITPQNVASLMVELVSPKQTDEIIDPACGTGGLLMQAFKHINRDPNTKLVGFETNVSLVALAKANSIFNGASAEYIYAQDVLYPDKQLENRQYDVVLLNPSFSQRIDIGTASSSRYYGSTKSELLFLEWAVRHLKRDGAACIIVPNSVLFSTSRQHKEIRRLLISSRFIEAVISLPSNTFTNTTVNTSILYLKNNKDSNLVWFASIDELCGMADTNKKWDSNYRLDEVYNAYLRFRNGENPKESQSSFGVSYEGIEENDYSLLMQDYKEVSYPESNYEAPNILLEKIISNQDKIQKGLKILGEML